MEARERRTLDTNLIILRLVLASFLSTKIEALNAILSLCNFFEGSIIVMEENYDGRE
jgi:hypothetical protein